MDRVRNWLTSINLEQYVDKFEEDGWDDLDVVLDMTQDDIEKCGITKRGHVRKIWLALQRLREEGNADVSKANNTRIRPEVCSSTTDGAVGGSLPSDNTPGTAGHDIVLLKDTQTEPAELGTGESKEDRPTEAIVLADDHDDSEALSVGKSANSETEERGDFEEERQNKIVANQENRSNDVSDRTTKGNPDTETGHRNELVAQEKLEHKQLQGLEVETSIKNEETCLVRKSTTPDSDLSDPDDSDFQHALVHLPPENAAVRDGRPFVGHTVAIASTACAIKSTVVRDSKNVTVAEKVEVHNVQESQHAYDNYAGQIRTALRSYKKKEHLFVKTRAYQAVCDILEDQHWAVISGNPGDGKSTIANQLMLEHSRKDYHPLKIASVDDWKMMVEGKGKTSNKQFVMIDDMFGSASVDERKLNEWLSLHDLIQDVIKERKGALKVVCTTRKHILADIYEKVSRHKEFRNLSVVDLTKDSYALTFPEKRQMTETYATNFGVTTDYADILKIINTDCPYGFPHCVDMFFTNEIIRQKGEAFFRRPLQLLHQEILHFSKNEKAKYCALVLLLFSRLCTVEVLEDMDESKVMKDALAVAGLPTTTPTRDIMVALESLNKVYVVETDIGVYTFKHDSFKEITAVVVVKSNPRISLQYMDVSFLAEYSKYEGYKQKADEIVAVIPKRFKEELISCLTKGMQAGFCYLACQHQAFENHEFICHWLKYVTQRNNSDENAPNNSILAELTTCKETIVLTRLSLILSFIEAGKVQATCEVLEELDNQGYFQQESNKMYISVIFALSCKPDTSLHILELFLQKGADVNVVVKQWKYFILSTRDSPLTLGIKSGSIKLVQFLLHHGASVVKSSEVEKNVLSLAAATGSVEMFMLVLEHLRCLEFRRSCLNRSNYCTEEYLYGENYIQHFISMFEPVTMEGSVFTPMENLGFECAIHSASTAMFDILCNAGADVNETAYNADVALPHAVYRLLHGTLDVEILTKLRANKYDMDKTDNNGRTLLHYLCCNEFPTSRRSALLTAILHYGIKVNTQDDDGSTPLHLLLNEIGNEYVDEVGYELQMEDGEEEQIIETLLQFGADVNIGDRKGVTPLFVAIKNDCHLELLTKLIGLSRNVCDDKGRNGLHYLAKYCSYAKDNLNTLILLLKEKKVDINQLDAYGFAPMVFATVAGMKCFELNGANIVITDKNGRSILMNLIRRNDGGVVQKVHYLTHIGADILSVDHKGRNLIHYIVESKYRLEIRLKLLQFCIKKSCLAVADLNGQSPLQLAIQQTPPLFEVVQFLTTTDGMMVPGEIYGSGSLELVLRSSFDEKEKLMLVNKFLPSKVDENIFALAMSSDCELETIMPLICNFGFDENTFFKAIIMVLDSKRNNTSKGFVIEAILECIHDPRLWLLQADHDFLMRLLQAPDCLEVFVRKGLICSALWPNAVDMRFLTLEDEQAIKVLEMLSECNINIVSAVRVSVQSRLALNLVQSGRLHLWSVLLNYVDDAIVWPTDKNGNNVIHHLLMLPYDDEKISEVLEKTLHSTHAGCIDMPNNLGQTPFMVSCKQKFINPKCIHIIAVNCNNINARDRHGQSALHYLVQHTETVVSPDETNQLNTALVCVLLDLAALHACLDVQDEECKTPLMYLLSGDFVFYFKEMLEVFFTDATNLEKVDQHGYCIAEYIKNAALNVRWKLHFMAKFCSKTNSPRKKVTEAISTSAIPSSQRYFRHKYTGLRELEMFLLGHTALDCANTDQDELLLEKIEENLDIKTYTDITGISVLSKACQMFCNPYIIEAFLRQGVDPNKAELLGYTALHRLVLSLTLNEISVLKSLAFNENPLEEMNYQLRNSRSVETTEKAIVARLKDAVKQVPIDRKDVHKIVLCSVNNGLKIMHTLLTHGADPNQMDVYGKTALHYCCESPVFDAFICPAMELLVAFGADVNAEDFGGRTPLMMCAQIERTKFRRMNILIKAGASLKVIDYSGNDIKYYVSYGLCKRLPNTKGEIGEGK